MEDLYHRSGDWFDKQRKTNGDEDGDIRECAMMEWEGGNGGYVWYH